MDECCLIPAALPPHKQALDTIAGSHRIEMIRRAIPKDAGLSVSAVELNRSGPSYTIDTVKHFRRRLPAEADLFLMLGMDAVLEIDTWKACRKLLETVAFIVLGRPLPGEWTHPLRRKVLEKYLRDTLSADYRYHESERCFRHPVLRPIHMIDVTLLEISSSDIRKRIRAGRSARYLLPDPVHDYIHRQGLYK